jgi:hypothetical protein
MRLLALVLLLLNGAYIGWQLYRAEPEPVATPLQDAGVPTLELLAEIEPEPTTVSVAPAPGPPDTPVEASESAADMAEGPPELSWLCYTVGPFLEPEIAAALAERIRERGLPAAERALEQREVSSYWVYLTPRSSRSEALSVARQLAQQGVKDYYVVTSGETRNAVSLGLFSQQARAERRARSIRALGFTPEVEVRYRTKTLIWVDYDEIEGEPLPPELWADEAQSVQRLSRACAVTG